jgi:hypothetical protein
VRENQLVLSMTVGADLHTPLDHPLSTRGLRKAYGSNLVLGDDGRDVRQMRARERLARDPVSNQALGKVQEVRGGVHDRDDEALRREMVPTADEEVRLPDGGVARP